MNTMINNISCPRTHRRRQMTTSSGNKIPGSNSSVGHKVSWRRRQRQGKGNGGCDSNHHHHGIIRTPLKLDKDSTSEEEEDDDDDNEGTTSTEFTFDLDDDSTMSLHISDAAVSSTTTTVDSIAAANDNDECVPSSTITPATSASSTREHNTLHNTKKKTSHHRHHQVHFGSIEIHEHTIQLGGAGIPSTSGPSLSLSWHQQGPSTTIASVIEYEEARSRSPLLLGQQYVPRKGIEMLHSRTQRIDVLLSVGYTYREIMECTKECDTIRIQRLQTRKQIQLSTFWINNILRGKTRRNKLLLREKKKKKRN